jgi:hypothetical protein
MNDWLDDLSEDWPSQPPSLNASQSSHPLGSSTTRLPKPSRPSGGSSRRLSRNGSNTSQRKRSILGERKCVPNSINADPNSLEKRSASNISVESNVIYSTVEVKSQPPSPEKVHEQANTPEWKRRLLQGDRGYGDQTELFGPSGIQNLFAKPPEKIETQKPKNLSFLKHLDTIPSSPPWQPSPMVSETAADDDITQKFANLDAVDEIEEKDRASSRQSNRPQTAIASRPEEDLNQRNFDVKESSNDQSHARSASPDGSIAPGPAVAAALLAKASRDPSAQSNNDSFSAVFISKHNTADGGIAYAPIDLSRSELAERLARMGMSNTSLCSDSRDENNDEAAPEEPSVAQSEDLPTDLPMGTPDLVSLGEFVTVKRGGYSDDGSFRRRPLSPSPLRRESRSHLETSTAELTIEESIQIPGKLTVPCALRYN